MSNCYNGDMVNNNNTKAQETFRLLQCLLQLHFFFTNITFLEDMRFSWRGMENRRERRKTTRKGGKEGKRKKERTEFFLEMDEEVNRWIK